MMLEGSSAVDQQFVDVGGHQLALQRRGVGTRTVVLDAGMGWACRRAHAHAYPAEIVGWVRVDATHPQQGVRTWAF